jgi:hypothetical protein
MTSVSLLSRIGLPRVIGSFVALAVLGGGLLMTEAQNATGTPARPAAIYAGSCDNFSAEPIQTLNDLSLRADFDDDDNDNDQGRRYSRVGGPNAVPVAFSHTDTGLRFSDLTERSYVLIVRESSSRQDQIIACGEIGGYFVDDDDLAFGLSEHGGSGFYGIAKLDDADDDDRVELKVFLASPGAVIGEEEISEGTTSGAVTGGQQGTGVVDDDDDFDDDNGTGRITTGGPAGISDDDDDFDDDDF